MSKARLVAIKTLRHCSSPECPNAATDMLFVWDRQVGDFCPKHANEELDRAKFGVNQK